MNIQPTNRSSQPAHTHFISIWSIEDQVKNLITEIENEIPSVGEGLRPILNEANSLHARIQQKVLMAHLTPVESSDLEQYQENFSSVRQDFNAMTNPGWSNYFQLSSDMEVLSLSSRSSSSRSSRSSRFSQGEE